MQPSGQFIPEAVVRDFIDERFEEIKKEGLPLLIQAWLSVTPEHLKDKWSLGRKKYGDFYTDSIEDPFGEIMEEVIDSMNYAMVPLLIRSLIERGDV